MKILKFDIKKGIFHYITNDLIIDTHSHPALEILKAKKDKFSIETDFGKLNNLTFAIIDANLNHKVYSEQNEREVLLIECNNAKLKEFLFNCGIKLKNGIFTSTELADRDELMHDLLNFSATQDLKHTNDTRIYNCIEIIESENLPYDRLITTLTSKILLSESRLSHLFTENVGISIKKYYVWNKLKFALEFFLKEETNLKEASFKAEFFDQAHLSNAFRNYLGINPAEVFNSRTLQL
jgi:AraC-like DNA-binding protein